MMYLNTEKKVAFIAHPRTASQATAKTLVDELGFKLHMSHHQYEPFPGWTVFATIRNPFDLLVSWYYLEIYKTKHDEPFATWLPKRIAEPNEYMCQGLFFGKHLCTDILHFENLQEEFNQMMMKVGLTPTKIPMRNVSERRENRNFIGYYTPSLITLVVERFGGTINNNGYTIPRN